MRQSADAYLDIETTGLSAFFDYITVIGILRCDNGKDELVQLVGKDVTRGNLITALRNVKNIYTYNGARFDLRFISNALGIDLSAHYSHRDLMYDCWECNLYGGFKSVERQLGIRRRLVGVSGYEAVKLWWSYAKGGNERALATLLEYNREDVVNLKALKEKLSSTGQLANIPARYSI